MAACFQKPEPYANFLGIVQSQALFSSSRFTLGKGASSLVPSLFAIRFGSRGLERKVFASYTRTRTQSMKTNNRFYRYQSI